MNQRRIIFNNEIAETGHWTGQDRKPWAKVICPDAEEEQSNEVREAVGEAIESLADDEREIVVRYFLMGESMNLIGLLSGRRPPALHGLLRRAMRKMRGRLASFVANRYKLVSVDQLGCCLCESPNRAQIDMLIRNRDRTRSWKPIIAALKADFNTLIRTPQVLIGHEKYHM